MMYYKIIGDRTVFSNCKSIQTNEGIWISNPTDAQIADAGWLPYVPPVMPELEPSYEKVVEAVKKMLQSSATELTDEEALEVAALYPTWVSKIGNEVAVGERLWYNEKLYKVIQSHTVQDNWTPDVSVSLFVEVSIEEFPEWVRPTSTETAYKTGDKVTFEGSHYISTIDANVWSPIEYPAGWELVV